MATLLLQAAGGFLGGLVGGPFGAMVGRALGGAVGAGVDGAILTAITGPRRIEGPRLLAFPGVSAQQGLPMPRLYGRARLGGQIIWMTRFEEEAKKTRTSGKFGVKVSETTEYSYFANLAVGLCEGEIAFVRRVWADGKELDLSTVVMRVHTGRADQTADPLIIAKEGAANAPAYRGLAYVVFERLPVSRYGNRVPQLSFEVIRPVRGLAQMIRAVNLIPGSTEFGYDTVPVVRVLSEGENASENRRQLTAATDFLASIDAMAALLPNLRTVNLVIGWFGDDLRAGDCLIRPCVDQATKVTDGATWSVAGVVRSAAREVSQVNGRAAYGGTPSDESVIRAVTELKARGFAVTIYPFVMMDVAAGNSLPDPWSGAAGQPAYPWRGRISCHPAPGRAGSVDGTAAAAGQIAAFFGTAAAADFNVSAGAVSYSGPAEWRFRRHVLHCAALGKAAGGVSAVIIGSEMVGLTRVRDAAGSYPAVAGLKSLLAEVRALCGPSVKLAYAADWTEYGAHVRNGGADISFPLDPLWADANLDAIGIDYYPPISDWRDGESHADRAIALTGTDRDYLIGRLAGGEAFDWYYANDAGRAAQTRLPISDGAYGKPWIYRAKDLAGWWSNQHIQRAGGVETSATAYLPQGKPIWLTEIGCAAVDKGANQPNLFPDPKSSESGFPAFSRRNRDDLMQARTLEAILTRFDPAQAGHPAGANPFSAVYGGRMIDPDHIAVWAYDARPFPAFPTQGNTWGDAGNWVTGHWLNGRIEGAPLDRLIAAIAADFGLSAPKFRSIEGFVDGYVIDRVMSARAALQPLLQLFGTDAVTRSGAIVFEGLAAPAPTALVPDQLVAPARGPLITRRRSEDNALPSRFALSLIDGMEDYRETSLSVLREGAAGDAVLSSTMPAVMEVSLARQAARRMLGDVWQARETIEAELPPSLFALGPGDEIELDDGRSVRRFRITRSAGGLSRRVEARAVAGEITGTGDAANELPVKPGPPAIGKAAVKVLDLPVPTGATQALNRLAVRANPWIGPMTLWRLGAGGFEAIAAIPAPAQFGVTLTVLPPGPVWRWDRTGSVDIEIRGASLSSIGDDTACAFGNLIALGPEGGPFEIISAANALLIGPERYRLSRLLRGLYGTEALAARNLAAGAVAALVNDQLGALETDLSAIGDPRSYRVSPFGRDHADPMAKAFAAEATALALAPLAPVRAKAVRSTAGVAISFIRRTRVDGDSWALAEVPLGEAAEAYLLEIFSGAAMKRSFTLASPGVLYTTAQETADFGGPQAALSVRIAQMSATVGAGAVLAATIPVN